MKPFKYEAKYFLIQWWPELHLWYLWRPCVTWPGHTCLVMRDVTETRRLSRLRWLRWLRMMDRGGGGCSDQIQWRYINILRYFNTSRMLSSCTRYIYLDIPKLTFWHFIFRTTCLDLMLKINCPLIRQQTAWTSSWSWINKSYNISGFIFHEIQN